MTANENPACRDHCGGTSPRPPCSLLVSLLEGIASSMVLSLPVWFIAFTRSFFHLAFLLPCPAALRPPVQF